MNRDKIYLFCKIGSKEKYVLYLEWGKDQGPGFSWGDVSAPSLRADGEAESEADFWVSGFALTETLGLPPAITLWENLGFQGAEEGGRIIGSENTLTLSVHMPGSESSPQGAKMSKRNRAVGELPKMWRAHDPWMLLTQRVRCWAAGARPEIP